MIRVLAMTPYPEGRAPGQRFRIEQWAPLLRDEGLAISFSPFLSRAGMDRLYRPGNTGVKIRETLRGYVRRVGELVRAHSADVVFVYREVALLGPPLFEQLLARRVPLVLDFDDAIYLRDTSSANSWSRLFKPKGKTAAICSIARHVVVGNEYLAQFARLHARAVTVIPTTIDTNLYVPSPRSANRTPVLGWTGSPTTVRYLDRLSSVLRRLRHRHEFELRVIGGETRMEGVRTRTVPWRAETEVDDLRDIDIGLMPLSDEEWSLGKCGGKALQYMALGIPPVVSPVGVNATIVRDGVNGFHARSDDEWVDRLALLLRDPALRRALGEEARKTVERNYSAEVHAPRMAAIFREAVA